jgi:hypothetical protein
VLASEWLRRYSLCKSGRTETHWRDLIVSEFEQQLVAIEHPQRDLSRTEQIEAERRIALDIYRSYPTKKERIERWQSTTAERFGQAKSQAAYYRRLEELKRAEQLSEAVALAS